MIIKKTKFQDLLLINNNANHDKRGYFKEIFIEKDLKKKFPFMVMSKSKKNVIRGLHLQTNSMQGKYISVAKGKIFDVALDLRTKSKTFGKYFSTILSEENSNSVFIPPGFAHGFCALGNDNYIFYHCTKYRSPKSEIGIIWNDPDLKIIWPVKKPIISKKDKAQLSFKDYKLRFKI
jgi:dTDP-4-dehydrorhamnose 3,5-epimerase|tara:strand:+ start:1212 stop:1742 length:531 start_codon:yes stop_codon:yes gene_type:complete